MTLLSRVHPTAGRRFAALLLMTAAAGAAGAQVASPDQLRYPELPPFDLPRPDVEVLPNGMTVLLLEDRELPLIDVVAMMRAGSRYEPATQVGLAGITAEVMRTGGTTAYEPDVIDDLLESRAASIEVGADAGAMTARLSSLAEDFAELLPLFAEILRSPAFAEDRIEVARTAETAGIARQNDDPQGILFREFGELIYGEDSPWARMPTYAGVASITREDLVAFHAAHVHPNHMVLGIAGDFERAAVLELLREAFGDWPAGPAPGPAPGDVVRAMSDPGVYEVVKEDMTQSNIAMGHLGITRDNPDFYAVEALNYILSGSSASRLFASIRTRQGLAYAVTGGVGADWDHLGTTRLWMTTSTGTTGAGIAALLAEAQRLAAEPPTAEELVRAQEAILNSFVFNFDSRREVLARQLLLHFHDYPLDWLEQYRSGIEAVTLEQVREAAERYVHPDQFRILVVGPSAGRDRPLSDFGPVRAVDIRIPDGLPEALELPEEGRAEAAELLERAATAIDPAGGLRGLGALRYGGRAVQRTQQGEFELAVTSLLAPAPPRMRRELETPMGAVTLILAGGRGAMLSPQGATPIPEAQLRSMWEGVLRNPLVLLAARDEEDFAAAVTGEDVIGEVAVRLVTVRYAGVEAELAIDPGAALVLRERHQEMGPAGSPIEAAVLFEDHREAAGLVLPHRQTILEDGEEAGSLSLDSVEVDPALEPEAFAIPEPAPAAAATPDA